MLDYAQANSSKVSAYAGIKELGEVGVVYAWIVSVVLEIYGAG